MSSRPMTACWSGRWGSLAPPCSRPIASAHRTSPCAGCRVCMEEAPTGISTRAGHGISIQDGANHRGGAALGSSCHHGARGDGRPDGADDRGAMAKQSRPAPLKEATAPRAMPASRSWPLCRSRPSRLPSTTPKAGSCARRCRPERRAARRRPASLRWSRRKRITARTCTTMPRCRTCSASPGTASRCMAGPCPAMRPPTAACGCRLALPRNCSTRRGSACA